jgi:two-component system, OmpR family, alkaline phosphatase synthesis response regulator PhoP
VKILIIEDDEDVRCVASLSLSLIGGLQVLEAEGGLQGLELAAREKPDAILLDLLMPEMDGSQTITALKQNPDTADIPVVFLTTRTLSSESSRMRSLGAAGILHKPFDPMTLASQLQEIINQ